MKFTVLKNKCEFLFSWSFYSSYNNNPAFSFPLSFYMDVIIKCHSCFYCSKQLYVCVCVCHFFSPLGHFASACSTCFVFSLYFVVLLDLDDE